MQASWRTTELGEQAAWDLVLMTRGIRQGLECPWASLVARTVKNPPAVWETWVPALGWEDPLQRGMATHSSILAWRIPRTEEAGGLQSMGHKQLDMTE